MRHMPQMVTVMTPFPHHIDADAPLSEALAMMEQHGIRHLPVFEKGDVVGVISERDLERAHIPGHPLREETDLVVGDLCRRRPLFVDVGDPLDKVLTAMADKRLGSVLVLKEGELAGVFTATDACRLLASLLLEQYSPTPPGTEAA
jgi:acetoin utilization protein AcuB